MPARPAFSIDTRPPRPTDGPDRGRPVFKSSATYFYSVAPPELQRRHDFVIHPEFKSEHVCSPDPALHGMPIRPCDVAAALIQRHSQRRYVRNSFVY